MDTTTTYFSVWILFMVVYWLLVFMAIVTAGMLRSVRVARMTYAPVISAAPKPEILAAKTATREHPAVRTATLPTPLTGIRHVTPPEHLAFSILPDEEPTRIESQVQRIITYLKAASHE